VLVAGTAASLGIAMASDRRLKPVFAAAAPPSTPLAPPAGDAIGTIIAVRDFFTRRLSMALLMGAAVLALVASLPALTAVASSFRSPPGAPAPIGPPTEMRAAAGVGGNWEQSYTLAVPPASQVGAALIAGNSELQQWQVLNAMNQLAAQAAQQEAQAASSAIGVPVSDWRPAAAPYSVGAASGLAAGTVIRARVTIYGCTGPGGGFCNHMASGGSPFAGAAACSSNLPFGTKLTISGDPTGRVYECLDRGSLAPTWIDVYFDNTADGIAWQSQLGSTLADIQIVN
jgi:hypothetical protein